MTKILVVDVNSTTTYRINKLVSDKNVELVGATTSFEAINKVANSPDYDMMIIDVRLGADDGFATIEHIKASHQHMLVVILTSLNTRRDFVHGLKVGASDYVLKPFEDEYFRGKLVAHIEDLEKSKNIPNYSPKQIDQAVYNAVRKAVSEGYELLIGLIIIYHKDASQQARSTNIKDIAILRSMLKQLDEQTGESDAIYSYGNSGIVVILPKKPMEQKEAIKKNFEDALNGFIKDNQIDDTYIATDFLSLPQEVNQKQNALTVLARNIEKQLKF